MSLDRFGLVTDRSRPCNRSLDLLEEILRTTQHLADRLEPGDLARPTPCEGFNVRGLLEHVIGWQQMSAECAADLRPTLRDGSPTYVAETGIAEDLRDATTALLTNLRARSVETITMPYRGTTSVQTLHAELVAEALIHTWDLATALGRVVEFDDEAVAAAHEGLSLLLGESFTDMGFRSPHPVTPAADELVRLIERSGRTTV